MRIVGVADTGFAHARVTREVSVRSPERRFMTAEALAQAKLFADEAIGGTADPLHVSLPQPPLRT